MDFTRLIETAQTIRVVAGVGDAQGDSYYTRARTASGLDRVLRCEMCDGARWAFAVITTPAGEEFRYELSAG